MDYKLVKWPQVQKLMELPWFRSECYLFQAIDDQPHIDSAYFVPLERLKDLNRDSQKENTVLPLLNDAQREKLLNNGSEENRDRDHFPVVKIFTPDAGATWLLTEIDPNEPTIAFGLCDLGIGFPELGYVSLEELATVTGNLGLPVECDVTFEATYPISVYARAARLAQEITTDARQLEIAQDIEEEVISRASCNGPQPD